MALKRTAIAETAAPKGKKKQMPEFAHEKVADFVRLSQEAEDIVGRLELLKVELKETAVERILTVNHTAVEPTSSVRLYQMVEGEERAEAIVSFQDKYSAADADAADAAFTAIGADINDYMHEVPKTSFDNSIYIVNGEFNKKVFDTVNKAVADAIAKLVKAGELADGTGSPLKVANVVVPKPNFHGDRMKKFSPAQNQQLSEVVKNTVTIKAG